MALYPMTEAFTKLGLPNIGNDDVFDRFSRRYSIIVLGVAFIIVTTTQFVGEPIHCFPQMVDSTHKTDYVNWVCWISSSYYLPFERPLPNRNQSKPERIPYYQWVPFILFTMIILFYLPGFFWRRLNRSCGINTKMITHTLAEMDQMDSEKRHDAMNSLAKHIDIALGYHREYEHGFMYGIWKRLSRIMCCTFGRHSGNYLAFGYVIIKLLYIINAIGQLFLLNLFMGRNFSFYGIEVLQKWFHGQKIEAIERFPRITMCRFMLRTLGDNIQSYDVQCLLPINIYNEKIFLIIWFWLAFVAITSIYGLLKWFYYFTLSARKSFIRYFLKVNAIDYYSETADNNSLKGFVDKYCRQDGILLLRIVAANTNQVMAGELICTLWNNWKIRRQIHIDTMIRHNDNMKMKLLDDHVNSQPTFEPSRLNTVNNNDIRYALFPSG